jgi:hypothetical protein
VRSLGYAAHPFKNKHKFMLMLTAYVDESGHSVDKTCRFVGLGGLVAPLSRWEKFADDWQSALDEFIDGEEFHMREFICMPGIGPYEGWKEDRRRKFMARLVGTIVESEAKPVAAIVSLDARDKLHPVHQDFFGDPYFTAFQQVTRGLSLAALPRNVPFEPETVSMVYAYQSEFGAITSGSDLPQNKLFTLEVMVETLIENDSVVSLPPDDVAEFSMAASMSMLDVRQRLMERARA